MASHTADNMSVISTPTRDQTELQFKKRRANSPLVPLYESLDKEEGEHSDTIRKMFEVMDQKLEDLELLV